jgi:hypothetical protein
VCQRGWCSASDPAIESLIPAQWVYSPSNVAKVRSGATLADRQNPARTRVSRKKPVPAPSMETAKAPKRVGDHSWFSFTTERPPRAKYSPPKLSTKGLANSLYFFHFFVVGDQGVDNDVSG